MWEFVSTRTCVEPNFEVPTITCAEDSHCFDGNSCTADRCNIETGECANTIMNKCCGNGMCEANESGCNADCGPFSIVTPQCQTCMTPNGIMFDVISKSASAIASLYCQLFHKVCFNSDALCSKSSILNQDILLKGLHFRHYEGSSEVIVYSAPGSYSDKYSDANSWTQISSRNAVVEGENGVD